MRAHPAGPRHADMAPVPAVVGPGAHTTDTINDVGGPTWPTSALRNDDGAMTLDGVDVREAVREFGSPLFLLSETEVRARAARYQAAYTAIGAHTVYYAAKAFLSVAVARWVCDEGLGIDVASGGELAIAMRAGVLGDRLLMHGNNKSIEEIDTAIGYGVGRIVIDSFEEIVRVAESAARHGVTQKVLIRATVGVEAHTHEFIATAHEDQKFGLSASSGSVDEAVRRIAKLPSLRLVGLHSHIGSQIFDASGFEVAARRIVALAYRIYSEQGIEISELNLGGGMGIAYVQGDDPLDVDIMAAEIGDIVSKECAEIGLPMPALAFEPGRGIVGPAGITVYEVGTVKRVELDNDQQRTYVAVDGGMSDNIRTALYGAEYTVTLASRLSHASPVLSRVVGKHCESGDIVVRDCWLPGDLTAGDLIAIAATGAYCRSMASNYNYLPKPAVASTRDGALATVLRRESIEDLLSLDPFA